uniref:Sulfotransferase domain-containing protein n=1 Tax=Corethron hystrix TaxID=216773 RepID=A0A7S1BTH5_9STRA|mmetsp:Transcript_40533/g.95182  ORF Transcript_40533/g.95182 Transcript_40533/m.95182 type:complete len:361 (+) Transcript_40533:131-1213(+)
MNGEIMKLQMKGFLLGLCLLCMAASFPAFARPTNFQEINESKVKRFLNGASVGIETVLELMGFGYQYDEDGLESTSIEDLVNKNHDNENATTIQVAVLGLGRTGTTSLALAMEMLGYTVIHDDEHVELTDIYTAEENGDITYDEFHEIAGRRGYNVTFKSGTNWVARHPEVKAILTVRDSAEAYAASWEKAAVFHSYLNLRPYRWMPLVQELMPSFDAEYLNEPTSGDPENYLDKETLCRGYESHISSVKEKIPEERLLVFNVKQGWEPLCRFLNKPVPEGVPFPYVHDRVKLQGEMFVIYLVTWIWPLAILLPLMLLNFILCQFSFFRSWNVYLVQNSWNTFLSYLSTKSVERKKSKVS